MTYVAGTFLGLVVGFGLATTLARRSTGLTGIRGRRAVAWAILAVALVIGSIILARRDHSEHDRATPASTTTSTAAIPTTTTTPATEPHAIVTVPNLVGKTRADALTALKNLLLHPSIQTLPTASVPPDYVLSQNPVTESLVPEGSTVSLVISAAP